MMRILDMWRHQATSKEPLFDTWRHQANSWKLCFGERSAFSDSAVLLFYSWKSRLVY